ncbi:MAG: hypothetical protein ACK5KR_00040 [Breznakia sp.]
MVTIKKKEHDNKIHFEGIITILFIISMLGYFLYGNALHSENVGLSSKEQSLKAEVVELKNNNDLLRIEVEKLNDRDTLKDVADENGLKMNSSQIVSIKNDE